ncbi:ribosomal protein S18-alanine N-acetyltransferase [Companilactobacillus mishanensis]|uniref:Ribosomal-protein-alanine N-acetyltransferase n=1 Tax=Companilactobacillus mishanensis TaxID=2486008 RepID=A0A5P0ZIM8_9LACO|nr:ribosomal protein S18-alanine N-acetyltransferase [Companilactobacillus mishanensis]MQS52939.1 ribosomal-protein-alanine N-acetyltransferase [Companilactobacillus mishanensis]MQS89334.1 ribosomal-protein-alanine N-acetyltransferase [Companilactobacillus mishanensis]
MWKKFKEAVWPNDGTEKYPFADKQVEINAQTLTLRKAKLTDVDDLMEIQTSIYDKPAPWPEDIVTMEIRNRNALYLVLSDNEHVVAFIGLSFSAGRETHITNFAILPSYQKFGLGHLLLNQVFDYSKQYGFNRMSLEVDITNQEAIDLYEAFGFETRLVHEKYYFRNHHDALEMVVEL